MYRIVALVALTLFAVSTSAQTALFSPTVAKTTGLTPRQAEIYGLLSTELGVEAVEIVEADVSALTAASVIELAFPGESFVLETVSATRRASGVVSWVGQTDARGAGINVLATLAARDGMVTGSIRSGQYLYEVRPLTGGLHAIARKSMAEYRIHDADDYEDILDAAPAGSQENVDGTPAPEASGASLGASMLTTVDVLFPYTTDIGAAFADPGALAQTFVDYANQVYANSAVDVALRLVYTYETPYASAGTQQDLYDVTDGPDFDVSNIGPYTATAGKMDDVHVNRDAYGADLVVLLSGTNTSGLCGIAWVNSVSVTGFSANSASCGASTIAHEIGHNFGSNHDRFTDRDDTPGDNTNEPRYSYGRGYVNQAGDWTTIMGYDAACDDDTTPGAPPFSAFCEVIPHLSNPNVNYTDTTAPIASGPTGTAAREDNARVHQERRATIAGFRAAGSPPELAYSPNSLSFALAPEGADALAVQLQNVATAGASPLAYTATLQGYSANSLTGIAPEASKSRAVDCAEGQAFSQTAVSFFTRLASGGSERGQSFTAPCDGTLRSVSPSNYEQDGTSAGQTWSATLRVYEGEGTSGAVLGSATRSYTNGTSGTKYVTFDFASPIEIIEGQTYTWFWDLTAGQTAALYSVDDPQSGGQLYATFNGDPASASASSGDDMAYRMTFGAPNRWASVAPASGQVAQGGSADVTVSVDATGLAPDTYTVNLVLETNDPAATTVTVPVTLIVSGGAATATIDGDAGWRLFAPAAPGMTVADLADLNRISGVPGYDEFNGPDGTSEPNLLTGFDGRVLTGASGGSEALELGEGFWWYLYDVDFSDDTPSDSYALPFTLATTNAPTTSDVDVTLHADGSKVNLLGNPFGQSLDVSTIRTWAGRENLQVPVAAIYNSGTNSYSFSTTTSIVSAWQGFYVYGETAGTLTIPESARTTGGTLVKQDDDRIFLAFELAEAEPLAPEAPLADHGAVLYFDESASAGEDAFDLAELAPLDARHLTLAFGAETASGEVKLRGHEGRPLVGAFEIPLHVGAVGSSETLTLTWPTLDRLPEDWTATLRDVETGAEIDLRDQSSYTFGVTSAAASTQNLTPHVAGTTTKVGDAPERFVLSVTPGLVTSTSPEAAAVLSLDAPVPNPARGTATVRYALPASGAVRLDIVDLLGRRVVSVVDGEVAAGAQIAQVNVSALASGVYAVRLQSGDEVRVVRMTVVR